MRNSQLTSLVMPLYLPALLLSTAQGLLLPVLPLFAQTFDAPYVWIGVLLAGDGLGMLAGDLPAGMLLRRLDRRHGMLVGLGVIGLATLALFWSNTLAEALICRFIAGLGSSLYNVSRHTFVADATNIAHRGQSVALLGATFRVGRMVGPVAGGLLANAVGLRAPFVVYGLVVALGALVVYFSNHGKNSLASAPGIGAGEPGGAGKSGGAGVSPAEILRTLRQQAPTLAAPGLGQFLMQMVRAGPPVLVPLYASAVLGMDVEQIGWIFGISSLVDAALFYPTGLIMDKLGRKWAIVPSALVMALGLAIMPLTSSALGLLMAAVLNGFGNGLGSGVMITLGADLAPAEGRGAFLGLWGLIGDAGISTGPVLVGAVTDALALQPAVWAIALSGLAAGAVFGLLVPETLKRPAVQKAAV